MSTPLAGVRVVVTRPRAQASALVQRLEELGAEVIELPLIRIVPVTGGRQIDAALGVLERYDAIVVTSANGADCLAARLTERGLEIPPDTRVVAVGAPTARRLLERGIRADVIPELATGAGIVAALERGGIAGRRVLLARARAGRPELPDGLRAAGALVDDVAFYDTIEERPGEAAIAAALAADVITLTSPSAVRAVIAAAGADRLGSVRLVTIGPTTSAEVRAAGLAVAAQAVEQSADGLVEAALAVVSSP